MALVTFLDVFHGYGGPPLLDHVSLQVDPGERVCLIGRNGTGKSTLMKILAGEIRPDSGDVFRQPGARFMRVAQEVPAGLTGSVWDVVTGALPPDDADHHEEEWERDVRIGRLLERMQLPEQAEVSTLSGGMRRRVLLAQALAAKPDLLLLDEPTNHLDLESIQWLEQFLVEEKPSLVFVTHDRAFLRSLATRILEMDRGRVTSWACGYDEFLTRREAALEAEEKQRAAFDKKLAQEEVWIRKGVRAQRTRAVARIEALKAMRAERAARRDRLGSANLQLAEAARSGVKVIETENLSFSWPGATAPVVSNLTLSVTRGDKIGILGPNGAGKTTLVKLLLGNLAPTGGSIKHGTKLEVVYLDQMRAQIDDNKTVAENINGDADTVTIGSRTRHVLSYLQDFLFEPSRARTPARVLSGGERNRLLLARLFTKPANVLVLDEPTNDLDLETLELLEDLLVEYEGTLILVSHDRQFLDEVVTSTLVLEGGGQVVEYVGGYSDVLRQRRAVVSSGPGTRKTESAPAPAQAKPAPKARKLNSKEKAELAALPARIEEIEKAQASLTERLADPQLYQREPAKAAELRSRLDQLEKDHATAFVRWEELEKAE